MVFAAAICLLWGSNFFFGAETAVVSAGKPSVEAESAVVMDVASGRVLYGKKEKEQHYPASITKIMTGWLACEYGHLDEEIVFSHDAVYKTDGSSIWREEGEIITVEQAIYALMLNSANDCAYALAEQVSGGDYKAFIQRMNDRAKSLGCLNTHFSTPHGLPDETHVTTAYDMGLIAGAAIKNELFRKVVGTTKYIIPETNLHPEEKTYLFNHHKMIFPKSSKYYEPVIGGKTGFTNAAGNTLVTFAERDGVMLVCVVMKDNNPGHYVDTRALLDYSFENLATLLPPQEVVEPTAVFAPEEDITVADSSEPQMDIGAVVDEPLNSLERQKEAWRTVLSVLVGIVVFLAFLVLGYMFFMRGKRVGTEDIVEAWKRWRKKK
jgi:D-alanyl-D-alanine carboxypeptidase